MLILKLKNSRPKLTCTGACPTNTRDKVMVTGEYIGCTGTPATLDTSHHNNHYARTIIITTHITTSVSSYPLPSSAAMSWSCGVVSTHHVSWVSGQWPVSTIDRNNTDPDHGEIIWAKCCMPANQRAQVSLFLVTSRSCRGHSSCTRSMKF